VSRQTPLHPDDSLERALDDMRQYVATCGDEGLVMRVLTAQIRLALLSILDTLIGLLADFRAGRLPPVLPANSEPGRRAADSPAVPAECETPSPRLIASRRIRAPGDGGGRMPDGTGADAPEQPAARAPRRAGLSPSAPHPATRRSLHPPRGMAGYPSFVPRSPAAAFGGMSVASTHTHFVAISEHYVLAQTPHRPQPCLPAARALCRPGRRDTTHALSRRGPWSG
jgi:hypothetical protein